MGQITHAVLAIVIITSICMPYQLITPEAAYADTTGTTSPTITIYYGTGDTVSGQWQEGILTVNGEKAYCVEVDSDFKDGLSVSSCDPVAQGIWSQEICTKLALIDQFVRSGEYVSTKKGTGTGKKVTDQNQQYAVAQCYIWKFLNDAGYSSNRYGWFGASTSDGIDLTGSDTDKQIWDFVNENLDSYVGSAKYYDCGKSQDVACEFSLAPAKGSISLNKKSSDTDLTNENGEYSLQGAEYGVFSNEKCNAASLITSLSTNEKGEGTSEPVPQGTYYVKETNASKGFKVDEEIYPIDVKPGSISTINADMGFVSEEPNTGTIELRKISSNATISDESDCYSLEGALYGIYSDSTCETLIAKMTTDAEGVATADNISLGIRYIREIAPPKGYAADRTIYEAIVASEKTTAINGGYVSDTPKSCPIEILIQKYDEQKDFEDQVTPQGSASLSNAEFEVSHYSGYFDSPEEAQQSNSLSRTWVFKTDERGIVGYDDEHLVSGDVLFRSSDGTPCMPLGTIVVKELIPPQGYTASKEAISIPISDDGGTEEYVETYRQPFIPNRVCRGDFEFVKYSNEEDNTLSGIPFAITSLTTGETHIIVTGEGGRASTSSSWIPHTQNTNANDWILSNNPDGESENAYAINHGALEDTQEKDASFLDEIIDLVSKSVTTEGLEETYINEESPVASESEGQDASMEDSGDDSHESNDSNDSTYESDDIELEQIDNDAANGSIEEKELDEIQKSSQQSGVWFGYGSDGTCSIEADDSLGALPYDTYSIQELPCEANEGLQLVNTSVVISKDNEVVDLGSIDDPIASIDTTASDAYDLDKTLPMGYSVEISDQINYASLLPNESYTITGTLMDAATGDAIVHESGDPVTSSQSFTPEESSGSIQLLFGLSTEELAGASLVVFEELECEGRVIASHEDLNDESQTVHVAKPSIGTFASNYDGSSQIAHAGIATVIKDSVSYCNLIPGCEYILESSVINLSTGNPFVVDGEEITSTSTFTPDEANGIVEVAFDLDAASIKESTSLVFFERIFNEDSLIASHENINDQGQTIVIVPPNIQTSLAESESGAKTIPPHANTTLTDTISYAGLTPDREYTMSGILMDKETNQPLYDNEGNPIETTTTFTPESSQGTTSVDFYIDGLTLAGKHIVAFETLYFDEQEIAVHSDINDDSQTVFFSQPSIKTEAADKADGDKTIIQTETATIVDSVSLSGVTPGCEYTIFGILMDKSSSLPLTQGGTTIDRYGASSPTPEPRLKEFWDDLTESSGMAKMNKSQEQSPAIEQSRKFDKEAIDKVFDEYPDIAPYIVTQYQMIVPENETVSLEISFPFKSLGLTGQTVVFEALVDNQTGNVIASHMDIDDERQTVEIIPDIPSYPPSESRTLHANKGNLYDKTGNLISQYAWVVALLALCGGATGTIAIAQAQAARKRHRAVRFASLNDNDQRE